MHLLRNKILVYSSLFCLILVIIAPQGLYAQDENPNERSTGGVFAGAYDIAKESHGVPFLDQLATNGIPAIYGEILSAAAEGGGEAFKNEAWKGGEVAKQLATQQYVRDSLKRIADAIGDLTSVLDIGGKLYAEQYDDAKVSTAIFVLGKIAGSESGGAVLKSIGVTSTAYVTAAVVAFQVWYESSKALAAETTSRQLESLYGSIELMIRDKSRTTLGQGDPFPPTPENVEKVWKRVLNDQGFRVLFKAYVTEQLNQEFPEPGYFDSIAAYASAPFSDKSASATIEEQAKTNLQKDYSSLKSYITGLVSWLNKAEKVREQQTIARQELKKLADRIKQSTGGSMEQAIERMDKAITMLGVVEVYLRDSNEKIDKAIKEKDVEELQVHLKMIADYVKDVIAWIPERGPVAERRNGAFTKLKEAYVKAEAGFNALVGELKAKLEKPRPPENIEVPENLQAIDPVEMFKTKFGEFLKPFEWGGVKDVSIIKDNYLKMLETGNFVHPLDNKNTPLPGGRAPKAEEIEKAWAREDYQGAAGRGGGIPREEDTIQGYKSYLGKKIAEVKMPDEITSLNASINTQSAAIEKIFKEGNNLAFGRNEQGEYVTGETPEQAKARRERGQALMKQAREMSDALKPSLDRLQALNIAWTQAREMANEAAATIIMMAGLTRNETTEWMNQTKAYIINELNPLYQEYQSLNARLSAFDEPYRNFKSGALDTAIENAKSVVSDYSYVGLQGTTIPESQLMITGAITEVSKIVNAISSRTENLKRAYSNIQNIFQTVESMDYLAKQWDDFIADASLSSRDINTYIDPSFMKDDRFNMLKEMFGDMEKMSSDYREKIGALDNECMQYIDNSKSDSAWLQSAINNLIRFKDTAIQAGVLGDAESLKPNLNLGYNMVEGGKTVALIPYQHYMTEKEKSAAITSLQNIIDATNLASFLSGVAPWLDREVKRYMNEITALPVIKEENFFIGNIPTGEKVHVVLKSKLDEATGVVNALVPGEKTFNDNWQKLRTLVPVGMHYKSEADQFAELNVPSNAPLAKDFIALREKFIGLYLKDREVTAQKQLDDYEKLAKEAMARWASITGPLKERIKSGDDLIKRASDSGTLSRSELETLKAAIESALNNLNSDPLDDFSAASYAMFKANLDRGEYATDIKFINDGLGRLPEQFYSAIDAIRSRLQNYGDKTEAVKGFYAQFKAAYEEKNESRLMNCLSDQWEAGDGTTLYDVEEYFRNMFTVFDEIRLDITNLRVEKSGAETYRVSYDLLITGRIYAENMTHTEKSSVMEEVTVTDDNKIKITRTPEGRFWYVN